MAGKIWELAAIEKLRKLAYSGRMSAQEIGLELGVSRSSVIAKMKRNGIPSKFIETRSTIIQNQKKPKYQKILKTKPNMQYVNHESFNSPTMYSQTLLELDYNSCHWPVQDKAGIAHLFCGLPCEGSYCNYHKGIAYENPTQLPVQTAR
jgi:hypothetical protein